MPPVKSFVIANRAKKLWWLMDIIINAYIYRLLNGRLHTKLLIWVSLMPYNILGVFILFQDWKLYLLDLCVIYIYANISKIDCERLTYFVSIGLRDMNWWRYPDMYIEKTFRPYNWKMLFPTSQRSSDGIRRRKLFNQKIAVYDDWKTHI